MFPFGSTDKSDDVVFVCILRSVIYDVTENPQCKKNFL